MAELSISQILASSFEVVLEKKPVNQWAESAAMRLIEGAGLIERVNGAPTIEVPLDYQMNPDADFQSTDFDQVGQAKTEVITASSYTPASLQVPVKWSKADEGKNPSENQKIDFVAGLLDNMTMTHDELIEQKLFAAAAYKGFNSIPVLIPTGGQGNIGGIDAAVETWHRNPAGTYTNTFADLESVMTAQWNAVIKGTGSKKTPKVIIGTADAHAGFEGLQVAIQRYVDSKEADAGFKVLSFKGAKFGFTQSLAYATATDPVYMLGDGFKLVVFKNAYRKKGEVREMQNASGYIVQVFSMLQAVVSNKSRLAVLSHA